MSIDIEHLGGKPFSAHTRYHLIEPLAQKSNMSIVYRALDTTDNRYVALKILLPEHYHNATLKRRFIHERITLERLDHPGIVKLYDYGDDELYFAFMVLQLLEGDSLKDNLGKYSLEETHLILMYLADALDYLHTQGVIHRDIKPHNIIFNRETNSVHLLDFGIAKQFDAPDADLTRVDVAHDLTRIGVTVGTPHYMSPEQHLDSHHLTPQSDQYSLAMVVYEMLALTSPYMVSNTSFRVTNWAQEHIQSRPIPLHKAKAGIPRRVSKVIDRALNKNPLSRYPTMREFADDFYVAMHAPPIPEVKYLAGAAAVVIVLLIGLIVIVNSRGSSGVVLNTTNTPTQVNTNTPVIITATLLPTDTPSDTPPPSDTPTATLTLTLTPTATLTPTYTPTITPTPTDTATPTEPPPDPVSVVLNMIEASRSPNRFNCQLFVEAVGDIDVLLAGQDAIYVNSLPILSALVDSDSDPVVQIHNFCNTAANRDQSQIALSASLTEGIYPQLVGELRDATSVLDEQQG